MRMTKVWLTVYLGIVPVLLGAAPSAELADVENPLVPMWRDTRWVQEFLNYDPGLAPRLAAEEQAIYQALEKDEALAEKPAERASRMEEKMTPASSALLSYVVANLYLRSGDTTNAIRHLTTAVEKNDRFLKAHRTLGLLLARDGRFGEAKPSLVRTIVLGGGDGLTLGMLGFCHLNSENYLSAQVAYEQAIMVDPDNADWRLGLIKCYVGLGNYLPAIDLLDELLEQHAEREALWALQANIFVQVEQPQKAIVNLEALRRMGKAKPQHLGLLADLYMSEDAKEMALPIYFSMLEADTSGSPARAVRAADILAGRGAWAEAGQLVERARKTYEASMSEEDSLTLLKLDARVIMGQGRGEEAVVVLEEILARNPMDGEVLLMVGDYYAQEGETEKADFRYERASKIEGFSADAWVKQAQLRVKHRKYPEAVELLRKAQKLRPRSNIQSFLERVEVAAERANGSS